MTQQELLTVIQTKPNFLKWAEAPVNFETKGDIQRWRGEAFIATADGTQTSFVFFNVDTSTGLATWNGQDQLTSNLNTSAKRRNQIENYLKGLSLGYFIVREDLENFWAEAEVFTDGVSITRSKVLVYKPAGNPLTHKIIV